MRYALALCSLLAFVAAAQAGTPPATPTTTAIGSGTPTPATAAPSPNVSYGPPAHKHHKGEWQDCHHNAKGQQVCRQCWHQKSTGKVRCNQPRITPSPTWSPN